MIEFEPRYWVMRADGVPEGYAMYRRHYSARKNASPKIRQFVGPGQKMVLLGLFCDAVFAWRKFLDDSGQRGVCCSLFRNESHHLSSDMIREAMQWAWQRWPGERLYTLVNPMAVRSCNPGYCFKVVGWRACGKTRGGLLILEAYQHDGDQLD